MSSEPASQPTDPRLASDQALYVYGVVRARSWRGRRVTRRGADNLIHVRFRDLEALVRAVPYEVPPAGEAEWREHQQVVDAALHRGAVVPFPFGVVFRARRQLIRMLQDQYLVLDDALSFLDGTWELRVHMTAATPAEAGVELGDLAMECYAELRRHARAAVPVREPESKRLLTAAFLVERSVWVDFVARAEDLGSAHPQLGFDVTGPWPPYDFVRISA